MKENGLKPIASFTIDHTKHKEGFYLTTIQDISGRKIYTYDLRFRRPNCGDYLDNPVIHTIEHILAITIRNSEYSDLVLYFGPMGCRTGFDLLLVDIDYDKAKELVIKSIDACLEFKTVPGATAQECGNYKEHDLERAKKELIKYKEILINQK
ncbi:MAG TPA: S-ribosylhomocysteine lyase [Clostridia bacterium]